MCDLRAMGERSHWTERVARGTSSVGVQATMGLVRTRGAVLHVSLRRRAEGPRMSLAVALTVVSVGASVPVGGLMFAPVSRMEPGWTHEITEGSFGA